VRLREWGFLGTAHEAKEVLRRTLRRLEAAAGPLAPCSLEFLHAGLEHLSPRGELIRKEAIILSERAAEWEHLGSSQPLLTVQIAACGLRPVTCDL